MLEGGEDALFKVSSVPAEVVGEKVILNPQPESLDRVEVGTVWRKILRFKMMPVQCFGFVPTRECIGVMNA